jgi:hypothetical protein
METLIDDINELREAIAAEDHERVARLCDLLKEQHGPLVVRVSHDDSPESPCNEDGWQAYSFSTRHANYKNPEDFEGDAELEAKLKAGLAFPLSYFEHGQCMWSLAGSGPQCRWDTVQRAGLLIWEGAEDDIGAKTVEDREKDAEVFLERFTAWCNGEVFGFDIVNGEDGCWGFYDLDDMFSEIRERVGDRPVKWIGDAAFVADHYWKKTKP